MTMNVSPQEWEALSAYLDNQLSAKDRDSLEERLQRDAGLRNALEDLRRTRAVLRSQPRLRAPRNFTLTPEMAGVRKRRASGRAYGFFRFAAALATILLVLVIAGDFLAGPGVPMIARQEAPVMEAAPEEMRAALATGDSLLEGEQALTVTKEVEAAAEAAAEAAPEAAPEVLSKVAGEPEAAETESPALMAPAATPPAPAEGAQAPNEITAELPLGALEATETPEALEQQMLDQEEGAPESVLGTAQAEVLPTAENFNQLTTPETPVPPARPGRLTWRTLELSLAVVVLLTTLATFYFRRMR